MERFSVIYRLVSQSAYDAEALAAASALENTVEIPRDVVPGGYVEDVILGRVEGLSQLDDRYWQTRISYHMDAVGRELPQFLNVVFGNASIFAGVKAMSLVFNDDLRACFPGPAFGAAGLRRLTGRADGGYLCPVIKPQGSTRESLATLSHRTARAGADIIKEDHGLANQTAAPFRERVCAGADAVKRANAARAEAGDTAQALYFANIGGHGDQVRDLALYAQDAGAGGILLIPGLFGFDAMNRLRQDPDFDLPIMAHPSHLGPYLLSPDFGYSHGLLLGTLMRLAGADISVFPNHGGRFGFSIEECNEIAEACKDPSGPGQAILPSPGGGMTPQRLPELARQYGSECVYLLGGSILQLGQELEGGIAAMREILSDPVGD